LLGREADNNTLKKLQVLALQRRAMDLLLSQEAENAAELGKKLGEYMSRNFLESKC